VVKRHTLMPPKHWCGILEKRLRSPPLLKHGTAYVRQNLANNEQPYRDPMVQHLTYWANGLGHVLVKAPDETPVWPAG
jgi:hypothetical protein